MNKRIEELSDEAHAYACEQNDLYGVSYRKTFEQKFAELIVSECTKIASDIVVMEEGTDFDLTRTCYRHFGISEQLNTQFDFTSSVN
jgi:hypothetical protein